MGVAKWTFILAVGSFFLVGCSIDETPADIHERLVPQIAVELIRSHELSRVAGLTPEIIATLEKYPANEVEYTVGSPPLYGKNGLISYETGISFYTKQDHKGFLALGLELNANEDGYIVSGVSLTDHK